MEKRPHVILPRRLVEISGEKPTRFVGQQWVNACREFARQMVVNDLVGQREVFLRLVGMFLERIAPHFSAGGRITRLSIAPLPTQRVNVFAPTKEAAEHLHLFFRAGLGRNRTLYVGRRSKRGGDFHLGNVQPSS